MLLDSKLLASSNASEGSSNNKPAIYEQEMDEKRTSLLTKEELEDEMYQDGETYEDAEEDAETRRKNKEMIDKHNERKKKEEN